MAASWHNTAVAAHMPDMTNNVEHRNRVLSGNKGGGQFANEMHQEPTGVTLTQARSPLDEAAITAVGDLVRTRDAVERGRWQRRQDRGYMTNPNATLPPELVEFNRQAQNFETLPREEQEAVLDQLKYPNAKHLLEPGQQLGNDRVQVAEGLDTDGGDLGLALTAQKLIADSGIPGAITLTKAGKFAEFTVQDGTIQHGLNVGSSLLSFSANSGDEDDYDRDDWLYRADTITAGGSIFEQDRATELGGIYKNHRECAVMMDVVADSSFRGSQELLGELNRKYRSAELKVDGTEYVLDVSGDAPSLRGDGDTTLHPSMVPGFLNHVATRTGHPDGDALASDLREVFRETDRRLVG